MARMIDAEALMKAEGVKTYMETEWTPATAWVVPIVDAEPVVRCKDCRWFEYDGYHTNCKIMRFCVEAEDYCSRGERREDEID